MILSRVWYFVLSAFAAAALVVVFLAVGQYNRRNAVAMNEELASDSQSVGWALQIDARRRLDYLLLGSVNPTVRASLAAANGKDAIPSKSRDDGTRELTNISDKSPPDVRNDALFAVDRDGRVVAQTGMRPWETYADLELGGYGAVFDALHGYLRDDTWVLGGKIYRVVARPVEAEDITQQPVGAVVGLRAVDTKFAQDLSRRTRTNVCFYTSEARVASAAIEGFDEGDLEQVVPEIPKLAAEKTYMDSGRSDVHAVGVHDGAIFARLIGEAWDLHAGYAVLRPKITVAGPMGFVSGADDTDTKNVNKLLVVLTILLGSIFGILFTLIEHTFPMNEMANQADKLKKGEQDFFQLARFRMGFRKIGHDVNAGIERVAEKGGIALRKPADLESILGPVPAQPAMSAFSFPMNDAQAIPTQPNSFASFGGAPPSLGNGPPPPPRAGSFPNSPPSRPNTPGIAMGAPPPPGQGSYGAQTPHTQVAAPPVAFAPPFPGSTPFASTVHGHGPPPAHRGPAEQNLPPTLLGQNKSPFADLSQQDEDEATMVGQVPADVLAAATGDQRSQDGDWISVYDDFMRTKRECGEPTEGLTYAKFQQTLTKNRDALMQRHGCKRVKFSVYVKEGRASLKATPVKD